MEVPYLGSGRDWLFVKSAAIMLTPLNFVASYSHAHSSLWLLDSANRALTSFFSLLINALMAQVFLKYCKLLGIYCMYTLHFVKQGSCVVNGRCQ